MLILCAAGAAPSSLMVPVMVPAVAASTGCPDGVAAVAAGCVEVSCLLPPQLARAKAMVAAISTNPHLRMFIGKSFLLYLDSIIVVLLARRVSYFPGEPPPPAGVRPINRRCSSGVIS